MHHKYGIVLGRAPSSQLDVLGDPRGCFWEYVILFSYFILSSVEWVE